MARGAFELVQADEDGITAENDSGNGAGKNDGGGSGLGAGGGRTGTRSSKTGRKWMRWTGRLKQAFLDELASTCDVKASALAIGVNPASVYQLRRKDPGFAVDWATALQLGYQMLETRLIGFALSGGRTEAQEDGGTGAAGDADVGRAAGDGGRSGGANANRAGGAKGARNARGAGTATPRGFDFEQALRLLTAHRQAVQGGTGARRGGPHIKRATAAETDAAILKQLAALDRRIKAQT